MTALLHKHTNSVFTDPVTQRCIYSFKLLARVAVAYA
jgi:hypothetical protein